MTGFIINTTEQSSGTYRTLATGDALFLLKDATIVTKDVVAPSFFLNGDNCTVLVDGTIHNTMQNDPASPSAKADAIQSTGNRTSIRVGANGNVSSEAFAIELLGSVGFNSIVNNGEIHGNGGIFCQGNGNRLFNTGLITSKGVAVSFTSGIIQNRASGRILATDGDAIAFDSTSTVASTVLNFGNIASTGPSAITFGAGNDRLDSRKGTVDGIVHGGAGRDKLLLGRSDDTIDGGAGADYLSGGFGFDFASYDSSTAGVTASLANSWLNTGDARGDVYVSIEGLIGSKHDDKLTGNNGNNVLDGGEGADTLIGGAGNDTLSGGGDADSLVGGDGKDVLYADDGKDTVIGGAGDDKLFGGEGDDSLVGGDGRDFLDGGAGVDILTGGAGNDIYFVDNAGDQVIELAKGGKDIVYASDTYALAEGMEIETLAVDPAHTAGLQLTGNAFANTLIGGVGDDTLNGGAGKDVMKGGAGDDTYVVDDIGDVVVELSGGGDYDIIEASVSYTLGDNFEYLILTGDKAIDGTSNDLGGSLFGNGAANKLNGGGGADLLDGGLGNDVLTGGQGADVFQFSSTLQDNNIDTVTDFSTAEGDKFWLGFFVPTTPTGEIVAAAFENGTSASTADVRIVYDQNTGSLFYDPDGKDGQAQILFAVLSNKPTDISNLNFFPVA